MSRISTDFRSLTENKQWQGSMLWEKIFWIIICINLFDPFGQQEHKRQNNTMFQYLIQNKFNTGCYITRNQIIDAY